MHVLGGGGEGSVSTLGSHEMGCIQFLIINIIGMKSALYNKADACELNISLYHAERSFTLFTSQWSVSTPGYNYNYDHDFQSVLHKNFNEVTWELI